MKQKKLWGGRFSTSTNDLMEAYSASIGFDWRLYKQDIAGSIAHARMLCSQKVLTEDEFNKIENGLIEIREDIEQGRFEWDESYEDIHMNIEANLTKKIGEAGKKLHTGRSRNDQIATDIRLYLRDEIDSLLRLISGVQRALVELAAREADTIMPGYTHMQSAQPVTFGHHLLAWNEMLDRDYDRIFECRKRVNCSPLGSAALAGTSYEINRKMTADELGFEEITRNSLDAVSDRDFAIEFTAHGSLLMVHLSRMSEEMVLWTSDGFDFVDLGDDFCTGSSIMPQKKNPDVAELTRGKCGRVTGNLMALLVLMKGQPLAYNRDNQEDKEPLFDTIDTLSICLQVFEAMIPGIVAKRDKMREAASKGYSTATDLADYLVRKSIPFRDAHEIVGKVVGHAVAQNLQLENIPLTKLREFSDTIEEDVYDVLTLEGSVNARDHLGGTAPGQVKLAAAAASKILAARMIKAS
ncbi:MAG: argininosuccinate lyase [Gammaproteobacteria bacterium]|nr:argininosuccinate lyase [Gammaproteobacteria bacterium]